MRQSCTSAARRRPGSLADAVRSASGRFARDERGGLIIIFTLILPVAIAFLGAALDYAYLSLQKTRLQGATDAAVVAAAREIHLASTDKSQLDAVVKAVLLANLGGKVDGLEVSTSVSGDPLQVNVDVTTAADVFILDELIGGDATLSAHAAARPMGSMPICVLGLANQSGGTIKLNERAELTGKGCAVYSNGERSDGITVGTSAVLTAGLICSAGGVMGPNSSFKPDALTECPIVEDPLKARPAPRIGSCDHTDLALGDISNLRANYGFGQRTLSEETRDEADDASEGGSFEVDDGAKEVTLSPGVYCGGLIAGAGVRVKLDPGVYVIKDGPLVVGDGAIFEGDYVGFYFSGDQATMLFGPMSTVNLRAPKDGPLAGLLMYENQNARPVRTFSILSDNARLLEGTLYFPHAHLYIDADRPIADKSAYTAIVTNQMSLYAGPHLVLNTDYDQTEVPVPDGIGNSTGAVIVE